jgi:hypothetical protein
MLQWAGIRILSSKQYQSWVEQSREYQSVSERKSIEPGRDYVFGCFEEGKVRTSNGREESRDEEMRRKRKRNE